MSLSLISMNSGYPSDCGECTPEHELPIASEEFNINAFFYAIYQNFINAPIVWQWAIFYCILFIFAKYIFEKIYYPILMLKYYGISDNLAKANIKLNYHRRSYIAANKFTSFLAAFLTVIRCLNYMYDPASNWNHHYIWNSIYIPSPRPISDLLDSFLGYFVFDTIYLVLFSRKYLFLLHHAIVPLAIIGVKSFGYGSHLGLPIFVTADATTIVLNLMWFAQDRVKYINFGIDTNNKINNSKHKQLLQQQLTFWKYNVIILQLIFGISFLYLRLGHLSYLCIPWVIKVVYSVHCNLFYKSIAVMGNAALLITGYIWSAHVMKIMYKSFKSLISPKPLQQSEKQIDKTFRLDFDEQKTKQT